MAGSRVDDVYMPGVQAVPPGPARFAVLLLWMGLFHLTVLVLALSAALLPPLYACCCCCCWLALSLVPRSEPFPRWGAALAALVARTAEQYFPVEVVYEDQASLADPSSGPFVFGLEPHSVLPVSLVAFSPAGPVLRPFRGNPSLYNARGLSSSALFKVPVLRHLWTWLGLDPADRRTVRGLLGAGRSVVLVPGGVQEALVMERGAEVVYLRSRFGFPRQALEHGAPLVPCFCFGQSAVYGWARPGPPLVPASVVRRAARAMGFLPMLFWGRWGTPVPYPERLTVVVGRPIPVQKTEGPTREQVAALLDTFIRETEALFERHKAACGWPDLRLVVK